MTRWITLFIFVFSISFFPASAADWEFQCEEDPKGDCLLRKVFSHEGLDFELGFGKTSGVTIFVLTNLQNKIFSSLALGGKTKVEENKINFHLRKLNGSDAVASIAANVSILEGVFSSTSTYFLDVKFSDGSSYQIPTSKLAIQSQTEKLGDKFYNKFKFPDDNFIKQANQQFNQASGSSIDEFLKVSALIMTTNVSERSVSLFYSYSMKSDFGDEAEKLIEESLSSVVEPRMEQICTKQLPLLTNFDGIRKLKIYVSLQGAVKSLSSHVKECEF